MTAMSQPWYADGLRFACTRCGNCCTGAPGHTWVDSVEIAALARRLGLDERSFRATYTRTVWRGGTPGISLVEKPNHDCIFWSRDLGCTVYEDRPRQCRTWPFWRSNLATRAAWEEQARGCPGMHRGPLHAAADIAAIAANDGLPT